MKKSTYRGVTCAIGCESKPWRAQLAIGGRNFHLGNFESEEEAARTYDNVLHYLRRFGFRHAGSLNFSNEYKESPPQMTSAARKVVLACQERQIAREPHQLQRLITRLLPLCRQLLAAIPEMEASIERSPAVFHETVNNNNNAMPGIQPAN